MGFMFCDLHVSLKQPFVGDINSSNLPCFKLASVSKFEFSRFYCMIWVLYGGV